MAKATTDPIGTAKAELRQLEDDRAAWDHELSGATADLDELTRDRGRRLIDGDVTARDLTAEEQRHRSRQSNAAAAIAELDQRIATARGRVIAAYIDRLEQQVAPHQQALDEHRRAVEQLLGQLEDLDGVPYDVMDDRKRLAQAGHGGAVEIPPGVLKVSRTHLLRMPVNDLRRRIDDLAPLSGHPLDADEYAKALTKADRALAEEPRTAGKVPAAA